MLRPIPERTGGVVSPILMLAIADDIDTWKATSLLSPPMAANTITNIRHVLIAAVIFVSVVTPARCQTVTEGKSGSLIVSTLLSTPQQSVLLKTTDRVLTGTVRENGNYYEIEIADQSRVSIPRNQVDFIGANTEEIYQHKRRSIARWRTGDHFQLTRWCIQNQLLLHAIEHFEEVQRQSPNHPSVKQLGTELEQKILSDEAFRKFAGLPPLPAAVVAAPKPKTDGVGLASATAQFADNPQVAVYFNDRIQPILMNRCSQAACHGATANNSMRLVEPRGPAYSRVSAENLKQVLAMVAPDDSGTPKLLIYGTKAHGSQKLPAISLSESTLIDELKRWIRFTENPVVPAVATHNPLASIPSSAASSASASSVSTNNPAKLNPLSPGSSQLRAVPGSTSQVEFPSGTSRPTASEIDELDAQLDKILPKLKSASASPRDPFDPAEFNRQATQTEMPR